MLNEANDASKLEKKAQFKMNEGKKIALKKNTNTRRVIHVDRE